MISLGYVRLTSQTSHDADLSLSAQARIIRKYAETNSLPNLQIITEENPVGGNVPLEKRTGGKELLELCKSGQVAHVIVRNVDRLVRDPKIWYDFQKMLVEQKIRFHDTSTGEIDVTTSFGEFESSLKALLGQFERRTTADRVTKSKHELVLKGRWPGGPAPFGYRLQDKKLEIDEDKAPVVKEIFRLYLSGEGIRRINSLLRLRKGPNTIHKILKNAVYCGKLVYKNEHHPSEHPPIVSEKDWYSAQEILTLRRKSSLVIGGRRTYTLSSILKCECGAKMFPASQQPGHAYYACGKRKVFGVDEEVGGCGHPRVRIDDCDAAFWRGVQRILIQPGLAEKIQAESNQLAVERFSNRRSLEKEKNKLEGQIQHLLRKHENPKNEVERELAWERLVESKQRIKEIKSQLAQGESIPSVSLEQVQRRLQNLMQLPRTNKLAEILHQAMKLEVRLVGRQLFIRLNDEGVVEELPKKESDNWLEQHKDHRCKICGEPLEVTKRHKTTGVPRFHKACWNRVRGERKARGRNGYYTGVQLANLLNVSRSTVTRLVRRGAIPQPALRANGQCLWKADGELKGIIDGLRVQSS